MLVIGNLDQCHNFTIALTQCYRDSMQLLITLSTFKMITESSTLMKVLSLSLSIVREVG
jgi:hypothetical protein